MPCSLGAVDDQGGRRTDVRYSEILFSVTVPIEACQAPSQVFAVEKSSRRLRSLEFDKPSPADIAKILRRHFVRLADVMKIVDVAVGQDEVGKTIQFAVDELRAKTQRFKTGAA